MNDQWTNDRLTYLRGLKNPTDHQQLFLMLADKSPRTEDDERKLLALIKAEKAAERAQKARADVTRLVNADKLAERKARDHELYKVAGLLALAGLVDKQTGKPMWDLGELLGALLDLAQAPAAEKRGQWKQRGDALLAR
jgi:hypothetical protein